MATVLVTGANRGIGLEFCKQYLAEGHKVLACCRHPEKASELQGMAKELGGRLELVPLDVTQADSVEALKRRLGDEPIDLLVNNAGVYLGRQQDVGAVPYDDWLRIMDVNVCGPMRVTEALLGNVARSAQKRVVMISSMMGSVTDNTTGGSYLYRSSKAALNMVVKSLSVDLVDQGITVIAMHPGWVLTDMGGPNAKLTTERSVNGMREVVSGLAQADTGKFYAYDGSELPW